MSVSAIRVDGVSKRYRYGLTHVGTLRDAINRQYNRMMRRKDWQSSFRSQQRSRGPSNDQSFWALKDLTFQIHVGDVVGIIGRNGAGKSTLLKILSQITKPSSGRITLHGRVASLLEVGTGFHPELTGRENVYMNGTILGMTKREISRRFDDIVEFAGVGKFIDTPVKRYSSGMSVRLGFAVAAHLEPEILIIDEVLAVGDAEFQNKCLGKMHEVARQGRTVLFVSHNILSVQSLCTRGIFLSGGQLVADGPVESVIARYLSSEDQHAGATWENDGCSERSHHDGPLVYQRVSTEFKNRGDENLLQVHLQLKRRSAHSPAFIAIDILDEYHQPVMQALPTLNGFLTRNESEHDLRLEIELPPLTPGKYFLSPWVGSSFSETFDHIERCVYFQIHKSPTAGRTVPHSPDHGRIVPRSRLLDLPSSRP